MFKLVLSEDGSDLANRLWESAYPVTSSILCYPEARAGLARARRSGRIKRDAIYRRAVNDFAEVYEELVAVGVGASLARSAGQCAASFGLRGYDAVHLATAMDFGEEEVVLVTWDRELADAAESAGLGVAGASGF